MTEPQWRYHTPERYGHAPDDWVEGLEVQFRCINSPIIMWAYYPTPDTTRWYDCFEYRYRPLQDAPYEPDLLAQCLALPQDQREALIEAMQKPVDEISDLKLALQYACLVMGKWEPGDSRAVSNEFVSMAAISCGLQNQECRDILQAAIAKAEAS